MASDRHPQKDLSALGREVCGYAVLVFYLRLIGENKDALDRAVQRVLLRRADQTERTTQVTQEVVVETAATVEQMPQRVADAVWAV